MASMSELFSLAYKYFPAGHKSFLNHMPQLSQVDSHLLARWLAKFLLLLCFVFGKTYWKFPLCLKVRLLLLRWTRDVVRHCTGFLCLMRERDEHPFEECSLPTPYQAGLILKDHARKACLNGLDHGFHFNDCLQVEQSSLCVKQIILSPG